MSSELGFVSRYNTLIDSEPVTSDQFYSFLLVTLEKKDFFWLKTNKFYILRKLYKRAESFDDPSIKVLLE